MTIPRYAARIFLDAYTVFVLILSTDAFLTLVRGGNDPSRVSQGSPLFRGAWALVYGITVVRAVRRRHELSSLIEANEGVVYMVLLTLVSALWSIEPGLTLYRGATLLLTTLFTMDLCIRYPMWRQMQLAWAALASVAVFSVIAEVFFSGVVPGYKYQGSAWHGVLGTKNEFARVVTLGVVACFGARQAQWVKALAVGSGILLAALAQSVGAMGYLSAMLGASLWLPILRWRPKPRRIAIIASATIVLLTIYLLSLNFATVTKLMGREPHMTGRTVLWQLSLADIRTRPFLGYGYGAFWSETSQPARRIREESKWEDAPHSHNGYIDLSLGLGLAGLGIYIVVFGTMAQRAYVFFMSGESDERNWALTYLLFVSLFQLTESTIVAGDSIMWILYCSLAFSLPPVKKQLTALHTVRHREV